MTGDGFLTSEPSRPDKGQVRDLTRDRFVAAFVMHRAQTPWRRLVLFWGVWLFLSHFCYFYHVLFGGKKNFIKFANGMGVKAITYFGPIIPRKCKYYVLKTDECWGDEGTATE